MTTGKRIYKPKPTPETKFILDNMMPVLTLDEEKESFEKLLKAVHPLIALFAGGAVVDSALPTLTTWRKELKELKFPTLINDWLRENRAISESFIRETIKNVKEMIRVSAYKRAPNGNLEAWVKESLKPIRYSIVWDAPGQTIISSQTPLTIPNCLDSFRAGVVLIIARSFSVDWQEKRLEEPTERVFTLSGKPNGSCFIGACPRDAKIYKKDRTNQIFCTKACADVVSKRRQRKR